jgi:FAD/FMN-containing dehydrogenase
MRGSNSPVSILGAGYSQGGQAEPAKDGLVIDMRRMNRINIIGETVHVEAGCIWADVIDALNRVGRSPAEMQSYVNFSVGGAIGVNCHGRGMQFGSIVDTIVSLDVVMADGSIRTTRPGKRLFSAVVGGYGLIAVVTSAVLRTVENCTITNSVKIGKCDHVSDFIRNIGDDVVFYNGVVYPGVGDIVYHKTWVRADANPSCAPIAKPTPVSTLATLVGYQVICRGGPLAKLVRGTFEPAIHKKTCTLTRNQEMWYDTKTITPLTKRYSRPLLQEYFVPIDAIDTFLPLLIKIMRQHNVNVLNISVRVVRNRGNARPVLDYAPQDRVAIVLFYNVWSGDEAVRADELWTRIAIAHCIHLGGSYYLPYAHYATRQQLETAYDFKRFIQEKHHYDPHGKLSSRWFEQIQSS